MLLFTLAVRKAPGRRCLAGREDKALHVLCAKAFYTKKSHADILIISMGRVHFSPAVPPTFLPHPLVPMLQALNIRNVYESSQSTHQMHSGEPFLRSANVTVFDCAAPVRTSPYHLNRKGLAADDLFSLPGNDKLLDTIIAFYCTGKYCSDLQDKSQA
jgi:hypothetical protein